MGDIRSVQRIIRSQPTLEGAGVHLKRAFGFRQAPNLDPFLLLDDFHSDNPRDYIKGFPWHPHRGIETITYVLHGKVEHGDSMGNAGIIESGDIQWMTAGSGIIHQEMPKGQENGLMWGFQLWANLPASHKMMDPRYRDIKSAQVPEVALNNGARIKVICGEVEGVKGPVQDIITEPQYLDVTVGKDSEFRYPVNNEHTVIAYLIDGAGYFDQGRDCYAYEAEGANYFDFKRDCMMDSETLIMFGAGNEIVVSTATNPVRFLLISGKPIQEPVAWYGPIVMNTQEELKLAFEEYENGTFIKHS